MTNNLLQKIKVTSQTDAIPILRNNTLDLIIKKIGEQKIRNILEIGTAYGYSAYKMSLCKSVHKVVTLEKNPNN
jgi:predicted O-methyltransferase YrrM